jgi:hypothetical protein
LMNIWNVAEEPRFGIIVGKEADILKLPAEDW